MGASRTPTYRVEVIDVRLADRRRFSHAGAYRTRKGGHPASDAGLRAYIRAYEDSTLPGGANAHLGPCRVLQARVVRQRNGETVASFDTAREPTFVAIN